MAVIQGIREGFSQRGGSFLLRRRDGRGPPLLYGYLDFSKLEEISTAAAVALAAEYQRASLLVGEAPPAIELDSWTPIVFHRLFQLGFFETVGLAEDVASKIVDEGSARTMRIVTGINSTDAVAELDRQLMELGAFIDEATPLGEQLVVPLLSGIAEAITNVTQHAYPTEIRGVLPRFWAAATADRVRKTVTVVVYDQGATIPYTFPRLGMHDRVKAILARLMRRRGGDVRDDDYIAAALRYGNSRTGLPNRGKGLPQMRDVVFALGRGNLVVRSGKGWCILDPTRRMQKGSSEARLGGTLIEWNLELSTWVR